MEARRPPSACEGLECDSDRGACVANLGCVQSRLHTGAAILPVPGERAPSVAILDKERDSERIKSK